MLEFKPKIKKCKKCGILYNSKLPECPMCTYYELIPSNKKLVSIFEEELKKKYGKINI